MNNQYLPYYMQKSNLSNFYSDSAIFFRLDDHKDMWRIVAYLNIWAYLMNQKQREYYQLGKLKKKNC